MENVPTRKSGIDWELPVLEYIDMLAEQQTGPRKKSRRYVVHMIIKDYAKRNGTPIEEPEESER